MNTVNYFIAFLIYAFINDLKALNQVNPTDFFGSLLKNFLGLFKLNSEVPENLTHSFWEFSQASSQFWSFMVSSYVTIIAYKLPVCQN